MLLRNRYWDAVVRIPLEIVLLMVPLFLIKKFLLKPGLARLPLGEVAAGTIQGLVTLGLIVMAYILIVRWLERRTVAELSVGKAGREAALGGLAGFGLMSAIVGTLWVLGVYSIAGAVPTLLLIETVVWIFVLALLEEIIFRGIVYRVIEGNLGTLAALAISATLFGSLHVTNENADAISVLSATLGGLFIGLFFTLTGRLWVPIFFHFGWNLSQIFWGTALSGIEEFGQFFDGRLEGPDWLTGGAFGPENSVITVAVCTALLVGGFVAARRLGRILPFKRPTGPGHVAAEPLDGRAARGDGG
jgi:membrane protease YdiL (CAAX protease family)